MHLEGNGKNKRTAKTVQLKLKECSFTFSNKVQNHHAGNVSMKQLQTQLYSPGILLCSLHQFILKTVLLGIFLPLQGNYSQIFNIPQSDNLSILQRLGQLTIRFCCPRYLHMKDIQNKLQSGLPKRKGFLAIRKNTYHTTICAFCRVLCIMLSDVHLPFLILFVYHFIECRFCHLSVKLSIFKDKSLTS